MFIFFKKRITKKRVFEIPIICVGNIYVGGTGKTPTSIVLSKELSILSYKQTLKRGFAVIRKEDVIIKNDLEIKHNDKIEIEFATSKTKAKKI